MVYYGYSFLMSAQRDCPPVHFLRILTSIRFLKFIVSAKSAKSARNNSSRGKSISPRTLFFYLSQITQMTQIISA